jgi:hypothetical protein
MGIREYLEIKEKEKQKPLRTEYNYVFKRKERIIDFIFCIDATESMAPCFDSVKSNFKRFYMDFLECMVVERVSDIKGCNLKIITFRDGEGSAMPAIEESRWFDMSAGEEAEFDAELDGIKAYGGGKGKADGEDALFKAMTADWQATGISDRQIIVLFTNNDANNVHICVSAESDEDILLETWNGVCPESIKAEDFKLKDRIRRMVVLAPPGTKYEKESMYLERAVFKFLHLDGGLGEIDWGDIIKISSGACCS